MRVSMSAIGSVIVIVGPSPAGLGDAGDLTGMDHLAQADPAQAELAEHRPSTAAPPASRVGAHLELGLALLLVDECLLCHGLLLPFAFEREAEGVEKSLAFDIGLGGRHDRDVHAPGLIDLVVVDFREDELLRDAERVVPPAVEVGGESAEVADTGNSEADESIEEFPHAVSAQCDLAPNRLPFAKFEAGD